MRKKLINLLQWATVAGCTVFIVRFFYRNSEELRSLVNIRPAQIVVMILSYSVYFVSHAYRYKIVLEKCSGCTIGFSQWFRISMLGRFLNTVIPQMGNLYRAVRLKEEYHVSYTRYVSSFFSFAWLDTSSNLLVGLAVIGLLSPGLRIGPLPATHLVLGLAGGVVLLPIILEVVFRSITVRGRFLTWLHAKLAEVLRVSVQNLHDGGYMARVFLVGLLVLAQACVIFYVCFHSIGIRVGAAEVVLFYVLLKLSMNVSLTPSNIGVQEIAFGILGEQTQIGMGQGMLVSAVMRVVGGVALCCFALPMGGLSVLRGRERYRVRSGDA